MINAILGRGKQIGWLAIVFLCVELSYAQSPPSISEESTLFDRVAEWNQEIRRGSEFNYEESADSLLASVTQREDSFHICYTLGRAYAAVKYYELASKYILVAESLEQDSTSEKSIIHYIKGLMADDEGRYEAAITHYETCINNYEEIPDPQQIDHIIVGLALEFCGNNYERLNDYQKGYLNLKRGLQIAENSGLLSVQKKCLTDLGNVEALLGNTDEAILSYEKARNLYTEDDPWDGIYALATLGIGSIYVENEQANNAVPYLEESIQVLEELIRFSILDQRIQEQNRYESYLTGAFDTYGLLFLQKNQLNKALGFFQKAIDLGKKTFQHQYSRELSRMYVHQASCYVKLQVYEKALKSFQSAYKGILPDMDMTSPLPDPKDFYPESVLLETLSAQAICYMALFQKEARPDDLQKAITCHQLANLAAHQLRTGIGHETDKLLLTEETHKRTENALAAAYASYQADPQEKNWQLGFEFAERSKANLLLEAFQGRQAKALIGLPDSIVEREDGLQSNLVEAELAYRDLKLSEMAPPSALKEAEENLYFARKKYDLLETSIEKNYPNYYQLKYVTDPPTLQELRATLLQNEEALIEFFRGDEYLYIFMLSKHESHFIRKPNGAHVAELVYATLASLTSLKDAEKRAFAGNAHQLYKEILTPLPIASYKRLVFIPDRELSLLPFEALLTSAVEEGTSHANFPFLIKEHICSYAYSANLLFHTYTRERSEASAKKSFLGMAPGTFPGTHLASLPHTMEEVTSLKKRLGGLALIGSKAQKETLLRLAKDFQILHLSTHAVFWDEETKTAWIALSQGEKETAKVRLAELASLRLNADITVLSACETGKGQIERGEGVMSLARAFTFAGSQATLQSLWPVRPAAAAPLMDAFYEGLIAGKDKATALHEAKLRLLNSETPALHAPVMWAAFAAIGDMRPIGLKPVSGLGTWGWVALVGGMMGIILGFVWWKRQG